MPGDGENEVKYLRSVIAAGAIVVQWNVRDPPNVQGGSGMWDTHIRSVHLIDE